MSFYLNGVKIYIKYSFFIIISLALILDNSNVFYLILFSTLHELGHIIILYAIGGKADELCISFYGVGLTHSFEMSFGKEIIFLLAGIVVNYTFAFFNIHRDINLLLALVNTMPIYPLDGGRALKLFLNKKLSLFVSDRIYYFISIITFVIIIFFALFTKNISLLGILFYIVMYSISNTID